MGYLNAQAQKQEAPDWRKLHYTSEEEMRTPIKRSINFSVSAAPTEAPRFVAEFEPMQGVTIRWAYRYPWLNRWPRTARCTALCSRANSQAHGRVSPTRG